MSTNCQYCETAITSVRDMLKQVKSEKELATIFTNLCNNMTNNETVISILYT